MARVLIIDDELNVCYSLQRALESSAAEIVTANTGRDGIQSIRHSLPDVVLLDVRLPDVSGLDLYTRIREIDARLPVIVITAHGTTETAIEAMKLGAFEYLLKPLDLDQLAGVVSRALHASRICRVPALYHEQPDLAPEHVQLVGSSPPMQDLYKSIGRIAPQDVTVLVLGESGTGKELVARAIYQHSRRSRSPFLAINCAAIPEALLESELFGHERGAYTGADRRRIGKFEQANGGTVFMDEVGDMAPGTQAKLLRLLQERQFERIGGNTTIETDIRVIAATNQDLEFLTTTGRFRNDLFYRLNVLPIRIPPLRERIEDIPLLLDYFLARMNRELDRHVESVAPDALHLIDRHSWPGNVRELESAVKYALVHTAGDTLTASCLPPQFHQNNPRTKAAVADSVNAAVAGLVNESLGRQSKNIYYDIQSAVDRILIREVLAHSNGNQVEAAELLGLSRTTLRSKLRSLGMVIEKNVSDGLE